MDERFQLLLIAAFGLLVVAMSLPGAPPLEAAPQVPASEGSAAAQTGLGQPPLTNPEAAQDVDFDRISTPEIYLGSDRFTEGADRLLGFQGNWKQNQDNMELMDGLGIVRLVFQAKSVNIVAEAGAEAPKGTRLKIILDGKDTGQFIDVKELRLYPVVVTDAYGPHGLEFGVSGKGFKLYTYTFG